MNERYYTDFTNPAMWMVLRLYSVKHYYSPSRLTLLAYHHFGATPLMLLVQRYLLGWSGLGPEDMQWKQVSAIQLLICVRGCNVNALKGSIWSYFHEVHERKRLHRSLR